MPEILKVNISPSGSLAVGKKFKDSPTLISDMLPEILGEEF